MNETAQSKPEAAGCPFHGKTDVVSPFFHPSMHEEFARAREEAPVFYSDEVGHWIVTRYDDVMHILHDHEHFSSTNTSDPVTPLHPDAAQILKDGNFTAEKVQSNCDGERHMRIRQLSNKLINVKTAAQLEPEIRRLVTEALDAIADRDQIEIISDFTYELPAQVLFLILGIPAEDTAKVKKWSGSRTLMNFSPATYEQQVAGAHDLVAYWQYCVDMVHDRIENPKDDLASHLLELRNGDDEVMTLNEVITVVYGLLFAGHETTTSQLANAFKMLLTYRENWEAICNDPSLIPYAVEEAFRFAGAVVGWRRRAIKDIEIGGATIREGENLILSFGSANRDSSQFEDPQTFDVTRKNARRHVTMGNGKHVCLGAPVARQEMKVVLEEFTKRFPDAHLAPDQPEDYHYSYVFQAPKQVLVNLR